MMNLPKDWDVPSPDNDKLCEKFGYGVYDKMGIKIPYRLFVPNTKEPVPLVIYLHGADAVGDDNEIHLSIHDIGTMFARPERQEANPCYILAPQYGRGAHWSSPGMGKGVMSLLREILNKYENIDPCRLYIYGYSAGGVGTLRFIKENPGIFAGAISICGATGRDNIENLKDIPLWMIHAADDEIVKTDYTSTRTWLGNHLGSRNLYETLSSESPKMIYTEYPPGWMHENYGINPHCTWAVVSDTNHPEFAIWLFEQNLGAQDSYQI